MPDTGPVWDFPANNGGMSYGLTDAARTYFQAGRLRHVTREVIQNSLDSHDTGFPVVDVEVADCAIPTAAFGGDQLASHFIACLEEVDRISATNAQRDVEVLERGLEALKQPNVRCLSVIDSGTRGLRPQNWHALVESEGIVQKDGGASGGSFGIGKNAVFTVSDIFTVIYSTRYLDGRRGRVEKCQGKARLMTHGHPRLNGSSMSPSPNDYLQNTGFYRSDSMTPLNGRQEIPDEFRLHDAAGTGIFILGFNPHSDNWVADIQRAVSENFFMAIHNRWLRVTIRTASEKSSVVDHETIDDILASSDSSRTSYYFYRAIRRTQPDRATRSLSPLGKLDIFLNSGYGPSLTAYVNRKGMLITASTDQRINPIAPRRRITWTDYTAVVTPQTDEGDSWVRNMESPAHDAIQPDQLPEPEQQEEAKTVFKNLRRQLRAIIDTEMESRYAEVSENLAELAPYLPEVQGDLPSERHLTITRIHFQPQQTPLLDQDHREDAENGQVPDPDDALGGPRDHAGSAGSKRVEGELGDLVGHRHRAVPRVPVQDPRVVPVAANQLRIAFTPPPDSNQPLAFTIHPRGYEATFEPAIPIADARCLSSDTTPCTLLQDGRVRLTSNPVERISILLETSEPIDHISAFDLHVSQAE